MSLVAKENLHKEIVQANLQVASVEAIPYGENSFGTIVNTMAFTSYSDAHRALSEMKQVLRPGGKLLLIDINYPANRNWIGMLLTKAWKACGDIIRDMSSLFDRFGFEYRDKEIGAFGSVHLYVAMKVISDLINFLEPYPKYQLRRLTLISLENPDW